MKDGFLMIAAATPKIRVADCDNNAFSISQQIIEADKKGAKLIVFPELCLTGYTAADLYLHDAFIKGAEKALTKLLATTSDTDIVAIVGMPVKNGADLFNCGVVIQSGEILGVAPKNYLPNYNEFQEVRFFDSGEGVSREITLSGRHTYLDNQIIYECESMPDFKFGVEICEDLWTVIPPSDKLALSGASIICNLSASNEIVGKGEYRKTLVSSTSARQIGVYVYADAGDGESTTDLVFSGHNIIAEYGNICAESEKFTTGVIYAVVDLAKLMSERRRMNTFNGEYSNKTVKFDIDFVKTDLLRKFNPEPFIPTVNRDEVLKEILTIQSVGLSTRLENIGCKHAVVGLSGGLDSTLALIVTVRAFDRLGLPRKNIIAATMPCFGTTKRTKTNAEILAVAYGVTFMTINISESVKKHFADIGHDEADLSITYENAQARERTQVLMDLANKYGGIVIGTGDLSELALGFATYNGDHMSMYGVNASIPKTLVRHLVSYEAQILSGKVGDTLRDILSTPVSPELLPPKDGDISQCTESIVGPYELHDFFLYYFLRWDYSPSKILRVAKLAFMKKYDEVEIKKWLVLFIKRFFNSQFKRSCLPDGAKVGSVAVSPRGDLRLPSDASSKLWLDELDNN